MEAVYCLTHQRWQVSAYAGRMALASRAVCVQRSLRHGFNAACCMARLHGLRRSAPSAICSILARTWENGDTLPCLQTNPACIQWRFGFSNRVIAQYSSPDDGTGRDFRGSWAHSAAIATYAAFGGGSFDRRTVLTTLSPHFRAISHADRHGSQQLNAFEPRFVFITSQLQLPSSGFIAGDVSKTDRSN